MTVFSFKNSEIALSNATPNTVNLATCVRLVNSNTTTSSTITVANATANIAAFTLMPSQEIVVAKGSTETLLSSLNAAVKAAQIAFRN